VHQSRVEADWAPYTANVYYALQGSDGWMVEERVDEGNLREIACDLDDSVKMEVNLLEHDRRQRVDVGCYDRVSLLKEGDHDVRPDEPRSSCNKDKHRVWAKATVVRRFDGRSSGSRGDDGYRVMSSSSCEW
jgi:hypothetical protein